MKSVKLTDYCGRCGGCEWAEPAKVVSRAGQVLDSYIICTHPETKTGGNPQVRTRRPCRNYLDKGMPRPAPKKTKTVYMKVTSDEYELPVAVADSISELAKILGQSRGSISSMCSRTRSDTTKKKLYVEVEIEDD